MSAEKIIQLINKDAESEVKNILKNAHQQAHTILENAKKEAKFLAEKIIQDKEKQGQNIKKISIAKVKKEIKQEMLNTKEKIINESFLQAYCQIPKIKEENYKNIVTKLMKNSMKKIGENCKIFYSREIDKKIANDLNLKVVGTVDSSGGFIAVSLDNRIKINNTFEAIINRKKDKLRIKIGKILFS